MTIAMPVAHGEVSLVLASVARISALVSFRGPFAGVFSTGAVGTGGFEVVI
jgi:hypothetical protein